MPTGNEDAGADQREPLDRPIASARTGADSDHPPGVVPGAERPADSDTHETGEAQAARNRADDPPA